MLRSFVLRLLATLRLDRSDRRLNDEIEEHLNTLAAEHLKRGRTPLEAELAARREFGSIELTKEQYRDQARYRIAENIARDTRFAFRQCRKNSGFTAAAVLSLALGIGANTTLFSFVNAILLKQLPVPRPSRLVVIETSGKPLTLNYEEVNELSKEATKLDGFLGTRSLDVSLTFGDHPEWVSAELVTGQYFHTLLIKPERGRLLTQGDLDAAEGNPTCVISYRLWQGRLHGAEDVIGRRVLLNTHSYTIIGVSQRGFLGPDLQRPVDIQIPATRLADYMPAFVGHPNFDWRSRLFLFSGMARLASNIAAAEAAGQLTRLHGAYLKKKGKNQMPVELADGSGGFQSSGLARPASILLAVSLVVLLIACANTATLLLSRMSARSSEFALRLAVGGSQKRLIVQMLVESALLAGFGTAGGIALAFAIKQVLLSFLNRTIPEIHKMHVPLDGTVLLFVGVTSAICVLLFGTAPALQAARTAALGSSRGNTGGGAMLRKVFVVVQIALSFMVVLSASLLAGTLHNLTTAKLGFEPDQIAAIDIRPAAGGYAGPEADRYYARVVDRVRALPGVRAAASAFGIDFAGSFKMELDQSAQSRGKFEVNIAGVNQGFFDTFGAHLLAGRDFDAADSQRKEQVYIINEHLARKYFGRENAVGRYLLAGNRKLPVVGVVSDIRDRGPHETNPDTVYQDAGQLLASSMTVFVRCDGLCAPHLQTLRVATQEIDPKTPILSIRTLQTEIEGAFSSQEVLGFLSTLFGGLAMLLVAAGIYGVLSYTLTRRTREMGLRIALGASRMDIAGLFLSEVATMVVLGMIIGLPSALAAVTLLKSQLFGVEPHDLGPLVECIVCVVVAVVLASVTPIRRALCITPQLALRIE